jgi:two-component system response regulator AlgR
MSIKILVVDDEELARERIKRLLKDNDRYKVCAEAENGAEALMMVERHKPEIVLLDISMPVMDGLEVATHL